MAEGYDAEFWEAFRQFGAELVCVDSQFAKRAFMIVWLARGKRDKAVVTDDSRDTYRAIDELDKVHWG